MTDSHPSELAWSTLKLADFESLLYWLLYREGFYNVVRESGERGCDLCSDRSDLRDGKLVQRRYLVQCRSYAGAITITDLEHDLTAAKRVDPYFVIVATPGEIISVDTELKSLIKKGSDLGIRVAFWDRTELARLLLRHQDLRSYYLGLPVARDYIFSHLLKLPSDSWESLYCCHSLYTIFSSAVEYALVYGRRITVGHLLYALLRHDQRVSRSVFLQEGINPDQLAIGLKRAITNHPRPQGNLRKGGRMTQSARRAVRMALNFAKALKQSEVTERHLLLALLRQRDSGTIQVIDHRLPASVSQLLERLTSNHFDANELSAIEEQSSLQWEDLEPFPSELDSDHDRTRYESLPEI